MQPDQVRDFREMYPVCPVCPQRRCPADRIVHGGVRALLYNRLPVHPAAQRFIICAPAHGTEGHGFCNRRPCPQVV